MPPVFVSAGGDTFHRVARCPAFLEGQRKAARCGNQLHPIKLVSQVDAMLGDYLPCRACFPGRRFATAAAV